MQFMERLQIMSIPPAYQMHEYQGANIGGN